VGKSTVFGQSVGKRMHGVYGFSIKSGFGDRGIEIEPFGNMKKDVQSGNVEVHAVREPMTDIFDETAHILVVAEVPGVTQADIHVEIEGDILTLTAERGDKKYRKEILLPSSFTAENMGFTCHGGVVEIRLNKWEE
jgi:HSP20 family protein